MIRLGSRRLRECEVATGWGSGRVFHVPVRGRTLRLEVEGAEAEGRRVTDEELLEMVTTVFVEAIEREAEETTAPTATVEVEAVLRPDQVEGMACAVCGVDAIRMMPVQVESPLTSHLFCCLACRLEEEEAQRKIEAVERDRGI